MPEDINIALGFQNGPTTVQNTPAAPDGLTCENLQKAFARRTVKKGLNLRVGGIFSIIFGAIAVGMGLDGMQEESVNGVLALIGVLLFAEGVWLLVAPRPVGLIVDGFALIILGGWNLYVTGHNASVSGGDGSDGFGILGVMQIIWGFKSFSRYPAASKLYNEPSDPELLRQIDEIEREIKAASMDQDPHIVEFKGQSGWKGRLGGADAPDAVFVEIKDFANRILGHKNMIFLRKDDVEFTKTGKVMFGETIKAAFRLGQVKFTGTISPKALARYEAWKQAPVAQPPPFLFFPSAKK